jgi:predicted nucleic acid-binding protein
MIVVDTNILVYHGLRQGGPELTKDAEKVLSRGTRILVPSLWRHEFANVLARYVDIGRMDLQDAIDAWFAALAFTHNSEAPVEMPRALEFAHRLGLSAYDAQFVALADAAGVVLVTEDRKLRQAAGRLAMTMKEYLSSR